MALRLGGVTRRVLGSPSHIVYRDSDRGGLEKSYDDDSGLKSGDVWYLTFRSWSDVEAMHPTLEPSLVVPSTEEIEREIFGETLDEEIPDVYWDMV